ncbi:MAG: sugar transferase [Bacteroidota bacterium]
MSRRTVIKRAFDLIISFLGLFILMPLFLIIGVLIKTGDRGPVLFRQMRVGKGGLTFILYKFRSMKHLESPLDGKFEPGNTSRITRIGRFLRKTKLDELPQLINVLIGDMSFVGPRPEVRKWVDAFPERWERVLSIRPGITDNASIIFRNEERILSESPDPEGVYRTKILPRKLDLYEAYLAKRSFSGDLKIILKTIGSILYNKQNIE